MILSQTTITLVILRPSTLFLLDVKFSKALCVVSVLELRACIWRTNDVCIADYAESSIPVSEENVRMSSTIKVLNDEEIAGMREVCKVNSWNESMWV